VYSSQNSSLVGWMKGQGTDHFLPAESLGTNLTNVDQIEIADLDNDGDLDIVAASSTDPDFAWLENQGSENFVPHSLI